MVKALSDFRELNRDQTIDEVLTALPLRWHSIPDTDAVLNRKHINHEKPMGMSVAEAKHVRAAVRKKGGVFQFGTQQCSDFTTEDKIYQIARDKRSSFPKGSDGSAWRSRFGSRRSCLRHLPAG